MLSGRLSIALVFLLSALAASSVFAQTCTPETCSGTVSKQFDASNCTGEPLVIYSYGSSSACEPIDIVFVKKTCQDGLYIQGTFSDSACTVLIESLIVRAGQCHNIGPSSSELVLCSVNDTMTIPAGTADTSLPFFNPEFTECPSVNNCPANITYYTTYYESSTCDTANATASAGSPNTANFGLDTCFLDSNGRDTQKITCESGFSRMDYYQNGKCDSLPYRSKITTTGCAPSLELKRGGVTYRRITCPTANTPVMTPSSSAHSMGRSNGVVILAILVASLVYLLAV
jgi:hypothetical protein